MLANWLLATTGTPKHAFSLGGASGGGGSTFTITGQSLGTVTTDRVIAVCVSAGSASNRQVSGVTIGGVSATLATRSASHTMCTGIYTLAVSSGATADIIATFSGAVTDASMSVFSLCDWGTVTLYDSDSTTKASDTSYFPSGFDTSAGGFSLIATASALAGGSPTVTEYQTVDNDDGSVSYLRKGYLWPTRAVTGATPTLSVGVAAALAFSVASFS